MTTTATRPTRAELEARLESQRVLAADLHRKAGRLTREGEDAADTLGELSTVESRIRAQQQALDVVGAEEQAEGDAKRDRRVAQALATVYAAEADSLRQLVPVLELKAQLTEAEKAVSAPLHTPDVEAARTALQTAGVVPKVPGSGFKPRRATVGELEIQAQAFDALAAEEKKRAKRSIPGAVRETIGGLV